ncbi:MAG: GNAT family N-acetyltransferase, partial [Dongiaceae bacterium]
MPDGGDALVLTTVPTIGDIAPAEWDACAGADNPFVGHAFLKALEDSGSVGRRTGWQPLYPTIRDSGGALIACAPMYLKGHSNGEYVFDHGWAQAYERAGGKYYPKLLVAVPFTPVPGPRLLARPDAATQSARTTLARGIVEVARRLNLSSLHINFPHEDDKSCLEELGLMQRLGCQYHWHNRGYGSFDEFLNDLSSRKRKMIRRERRQAVADGIVLRALTGPDIQSHHWDAFFAFYMDTGERKWGRPYLTRGFFDCIGQFMADRVVLMLAEMEGRPVAGALNFRGKDALYGRNWGCLADYKFLHFETCYYQAIDYAIAQ